MATGNNNLSFLTSNKEKPLLLLDGFLFKINKETKNKKYWTCRSASCRASVHTDANNALLKSSWEPDHLPEPEDIQIKAFREKLKSRTVNETIPIATIYEEEVIKADLPARTLASLPLAREIQPGLAQARRQLTPTLPNSAFFDIPESYQRTTKGEHFLFCDTSVRRRKRMLLFGSTEQLQLLFDSSIIMMDGTFNASPPFFDQVYTIHAIKYETSFPCVFGILPDRKKLTYEQLFQELKSMAASMNRIFKPERIMSDFEPSLLPAVAHEAIHRRIQALGLTKSYAENEDIRTCCKKLMALALLPCEEVETAYYNLRSTSSAPVKDSLRQLFLYFDTQWLSQVPIEMWNVHGLNHRTNNNCEGFHNRLNQRIIRSHPNIWSFIRCLQNEQYRMYHLLLQMDAGARPRQPAPATNRIQNRMETLNDRYAGGKITIEELLEGMSLLVGTHKK